MCVGIPHRRALGVLEVKETKDRSRGLEGSPATGKERECCRPDLRAMSPCPPLSLLLALLTQLLPPSFSSFYSALYGGQVDTRGASLTVPAPAFPGCQQTLGHTRLPQLRSQERTSLHRMDCLLGLKIIFLLIPMLSIKPLRSLTSLNSHLGVVFLLFSLCLTASSHSAPSPCALYFLKLCGINSVGSTLWEKILFMLSALTPWMLSLV